MEQENAKKRLDDATTLMESLCREAGCRQPEMLPEIEKRSANAGFWIVKTTDIENRLRRLSAGATVEAFVAEADSVAAGQP
jgi:hypothetical protein